LAFTRQGCHTGRIVRPAARPVSHCRSLASSLTGNRAAGLHVQSPARLCLPPLLAPARRSARRLRWPMRRTLQHVISSWIMSTINPPPPMGS
jgi:hypothetical protein